MISERDKEVAELSNEWPATHSQMRPVSELTAYARNARTHSKQQVARIARSIEEFGWTNPVLITEKDGIIAGHGRILAAQLLEIVEVPVIVASGWTEAQQRAYVIADNKLALDAGWDNEVLAIELGELQNLDFDLDLTGFGKDEVQRLLFSEADKLDGADATPTPEVETVKISKTGDLWILGHHRVLCGDSTRGDDVARLMGKETAHCIMSDPPYGMGKESEGIANDNLYRDKLDAFQMSWWRAFRDSLDENGSLYIWGNPADLWRLWYTGGLMLDGELLVRNEIVWDKGSGFGMTSAGQHSYSISTERCLFIMRGQQFLGNQNKEDYWEGWEPLRVWLTEQRDKAGWNVSDIRKITGTQMAGHWFGKSQFQPISKKHYKAMQAAADGVAFVEDYDELFVSLFPDAKDGGNEHRRNLFEQIRESRTWFDNTHDTMTEVWNFPRVHGEDRFSHATPKPVAMIGRIVKSSVPEDGLVVDPFAGTGTTLIAAELLRRRCFTMELEPAYVDVVIRRWQEQAGAAAVLDGDGRTFAAIEGGGR